MIISFLSKTTVFWCCWIYFVDITFSNYVGLRSSYYVDLNLTKLHHPAAAAAAAAVVALFAIFALFALFALFAAIHTTLVKFRFEGTKKADSGFS